MWRYELITKEEMDNFCKGEMKLKDSVNDDLESLFENIQLEKAPDEDVITFHLRKQINVTMTDFILCFFIPFKIIDFSLFEL